MAIFICIFSAIQGPVYYMLKCLVNQHNTQPFLMVQFSYILVLKVLGLVQNSGLFLVW